MNKHLSSIKKTAVLVAVSWLAMPAFAGLGGFVDAQVGGSQVGNGAVTPLNSEIADAAVYLSKELGRGKMMLDLPFSFSAANAAIPLTMGGLGVQYPYETGFRAFDTKAQAYISWSYDFGLSWTLGRFDSPFLNEANDTVGLNAYTTQGSVFATLPRMHNGLMLSYGQGPVTVTGIVSREGGTVGARTGASAGENLEYGVMGKFTHDMGYLGAGLYLHNPGNSATPNTNNHSIIEVMAGTKVSDLTIDAQLVLGKLATAGVDTGLGVGGTINYAMDKMWSIGVRPNYTSKIGAATTHAGAAPTNSAFEVAVGPQAQMSDDLRLRANYTWTSRKASENAASVSDSEWALSAVYKF